MMDLSYAAADPIIYKRVGPGIIIKDSVIIKDSLIVKGVDNNLIGPALNKDSIWEFSYLITKKH